MVALTKLRAWARIAAEVPFLYITSTESSLAPTTVVFAGVLTCAAPKHGNKARLNTDNLVFIFTIHNLLN